MKPIASVEIGQSAGPVVVFAHGWDRTHRDFLPVAELIGGHARCLLLDLPGFGDSPNPDEGWGSLDYATHLRAFLADQGIDRFTWVGHSYGGRVGLRLGAMDDSPLERLVIVAGAGVKVPVPQHKQLRGKFRAWQFRRKRAQALNPAAVIALEQEYGSPDYVRSRDLGLRETFVKAVQEDQRRSARKITCATTLIYGGKDTETPPAEGRLLHKLIKGSVYVECPEFDHLSVLTRGRHQIASVLKDSLGEPS